MINLKVYNIYLKAAGVAKNRNINNVGFGINIQIWSSNIYRKFSKEDLEMITN